MIVDSEVPLTCSYFGPSPLETLGRIERHTYFFQLFVILSVVRRHIA